MSEMVERVRDALCRVLDDYYEPFDGFSDGYEDAAARAVIVAMHEPTEAMLKAEGPFGRRVDNYLDDWDAVDVWRAMIDEALKE